MKLYWQLFCSFFKIGLFTFGGGYAMLPMLQKEIVQKGWANENEILDYYAIGQMTPGIIAINVSTFIGFRKGGFWGTIFAALGIVTPSICIISMLAFGLSFLLDNPLVQHAFAGIQLMIPALIAPVLFKMIKKSMLDYFTVLILIFALFCSLTKAFEPIIILILSGLLGLLYKNFKGKNRND